MNIVEILAPIIVFGVIALVVYRYWIYFKAKYPKQAKKLKQIKLFPRP